MKINVGFVLSHYVRGLLLQQLLALIHSPLRLPDTAACSATDWSSSTCAPETRSGLLSRNHCKFLLAPSPCPINDYPQHHLFLLSLQSRNVLAQRNSGAVDTQGIAIIT